MKFLNGVFAVLLAAAPLIDVCWAQNAAPTVLTDPATGITFDSWSVPNAPPNGDSEGPETLGGLTFGVALPADALTNNANEFIGYLQCASTNATFSGWCGVSLGGGMTDSLLLMAWPYNGTILTSFRYATAYSFPAVYNGTAALTQISSTINSTHYTLIFRCQNCLSWSENGQPGSASTSSGVLVLGWSQAFPSPTNPQCPDLIGMVQHDNGMNIFGASLDSHAASSNYTAWTALATKTVTGNCTGLTAAVITPVPVPTNEPAWDYIVVGGGAGGLTIADRLSEAGHSVLLIEKGPPSLGRWGGEMRPDWLGGTNLTRFDVPGLCNEIWVNAGGVTCTDTDQVAGCVLGGGTAVNAGLWWKPNPIDWDYNFPTGWHSTDMAAATQRVFLRIPGTDHPSTDGQLYLQQGFDVLTGGLAAAGWRSVTANNSPNLKNHTFAHTAYMYSGGQRGGPLTTYLAEAVTRKNFQMWLNTSVTRIVRTNGHATAVEVEAFDNGGYQGTVNLTANTGRVILSAGTFGSAKLLLRSGIGPEDQLQVVQASSDGPTMINSSQWINLPVGYNLDDHCNTDTVITHPDVVFYDFYAAWTAPNVTDEDAYLNHRSGILTQAAPNIGPMFWDEILGSDGVVRQLQWTARVEGSDGTPSGNAMTLSQYLGRGSKSRGRMTITEGLDTVVSTLPWLHDQYDVEAIIQGIKNLQASLSSVKNLTWTYPNSTTTVEDFVNNMLVAYSNRRANHWIGTNKIGPDDGRVANGTAVVDLNTQVYGTDNIFVVDGSIFPGMPTTNPSAYIVVVAEHAADKILALPYQSKNTNSTSSSSSSSSSSKASTSTSSKSASSSSSSPSHTTTSPTTTHTTTTTTTTPAPGPSQAHWSQCGGIGWTGPTACSQPYACSTLNPYYYQCA